MDGLIGILVLIGIFSSLSKKKKKAQKQTRQTQPESRSEKAPGQTKIPFTKEEWETYLAEMEKTKKKPAARPAKPSTVKNNAKAASPAPVLHIDHDEPEGTVSTQGESAAEHTEHRQRILAEEAKLREHQETLQELRHLNRQKLRNAMVMSEVLGKPVSLRPRPYR